MTVISKKPQIPDSPCDRELYFASTDFRGVNWEDEDVSGQSLQDRDFREAILWNASFAKCNLSAANFENADLSGANFRGANLENANFSNANLSRANFFQASLVGAKFINSNLFATNFRESTMGQTVFAGVELETCSGLDTVEHLSHSSIGVECLYALGNNRPEKFLSKVGFPQIFRQYLPSLIDAAETVQFNSCFISYSHEDEGFAHTLWSEMRKARIRVWYAPEQMRGGKKLIEQIDRAIQLHDKLLIVLSKASMASSWVATEIRRARKHERCDGVRKLFPIRVCEMNELRKWECFDADSGRDIAEEVREYFIPNFSNWTNSTQFNSEFQKLCRDLRREGVEMTP